MMAPLHAAQPGVTQYLPVGSGFTEHFRVIGALALARVQST
jgi:hypothetical protein